jgi:hypothetical protein
METSLPLQQTGRLGFCEQTAPWPQADLGAGDLAEIYSYRRAESRHSETIWMAHVPAHLLNSSAKRRDRIQSDARAPATFLITFNVGCLHASDFASEARSTSGRTQSCVCVGNELLCSRVKRATVKKRSTRENASNRRKGVQKGCGNAPFCTLVGCSEIRSTLLEGMAGTTRLELATSAVTVHCYLVTA